MRSCQALEAQPPPKAEIGGGGANYTFTEISHIMWFFAGNLI